MSVRNIERYCWDTVTVRCASARDAHGRPTGAAVEHESAARVELKARRLVDSRGQEFVAAGQVFLPWSADWTIRAGDEIEFAGTRYTVAAVYTERGWEGDTAQHWRVVIR